LQDPFAQKEEYNDSWFDKFMVDYFAKQMSKQLGGGGLNLPLRSHPHHLTFTAPDQKQACGWVSASNLETPGLRK
jgi:hypothetical protein